MKELYKALAAFQQEVPHIYKGTEGYGYSYADWGQILDVINPLMAKHGLGFTQLLDGTKLRTIIFLTELDQTIESSVDIPQDVTLAKMNTFQVMGSAITYYKRYALSAMLGLVTDADKDASGEQVKPKSTKEPIPRNTGTPEPMGEDTSTVLARAKVAINAEMEAQGYEDKYSKKAKIVEVLKKETVDSIDDADILMDVLENER